MQISSEQDEQVNEILRCWQTGEQAPLTAWNKIKQLLLDWHLAYYVVLTATKVMCHIGNRSGLMLNPYNCHQVGASIHAVGADKDELRGSTVFELSHDPEKAQMAWYKNKELVDNSKALLAPLTGEETD